MVNVSAKIKLYPTPEQELILRETMLGYAEVCNHVSKWVFENGAKKLPKATEVNAALYHGIRAWTKITSGHVQNTFRTVLARYKTNKSNGHEFSQVEFRYECDLVWNRDYALFDDGVFSIATTQGRQKMSFEVKGMEKYFDKTWKFGGAKIVNKFGKWFLHVGMGKEFEESPIENVMGIDLGINHIATTYDSNGKTKFYRGGEVKDYRGKKKALRRQLQIKQTPSARKRIKKIGNRESGYVKDVNHRITKTLVSQAPKGTLFVLEDLTGIRNATEKVRTKHRYVSVSWAFFEFRKMLEYKAKMYGHKVVCVSPKYTSQDCPKCGHREKSNRDKANHRFCCKKCQYKSNDDRIGAMNLFWKGIEHLREQGA